MSDAPDLDLGRELGGRFVARRSLPGGVSADVQAVDLAGPEGRRTVVVRQKDDAAGLAHEHAVMTVLAEILPAVPRPLALSQRLPLPAMVLPLVEGTIDPPELRDGLHPMAAWLAALHGLDVDDLGLPATLERRTQPLPELLAWLPERFDDLRQDFERGGGALAPVRPSMLHGDYWVGNLIWRDGELVGVIDWEDAAVGDPAADLAGARLELVWRFGFDAADELSEHYVALRGHPGQRRLALWELYVASAGLAYMHLWGLPGEQEAHNRRGAQAVLDRAAAVLRR